MGKEQPREMMKQDPDMLDSRRNQMRYRITYNDGMFADWDSMQKELAWAYKWGRLGVFLYAVRLNIGAWRGGHKSLTYWRYVMSRKPKITRRET